MAYIRGEAREQVTNFGRTDPGRPHVSGDRGVCRPAGDDESGFRACGAAETGRPGYDPPDLLDLYLFGYPDVR